MHMTEDPQRLVLQDSPGCFWLFGLFFVLIGGLILIASLNEVRAAERPIWQIFLAIAMALAAVVTGVAFIMQAPSSRVVLDVGARTLMITRRGLFLHQVEHYRWDEIRSVERVEMGDIDGDPVYSLALHLRDGRSVQVTHLWVHDPEGLARNVAMLRRYLAI